MPQIVLPTPQLREFGAAWEANGQRLSRTPPFSSLELGTLVDTVVAEALAAMLGGLPIVQGNADALLPPQPDCVEYGHIRVAGGIRPQNFDVGYRPDGVRFVFDSKTLNDLASVRKNYQNMINDLAAEAATVHTRFPYAVVALLVLVPAPCIVEPQRSALVRSLEVLNRRTGVGDPAHLAEAATLVLWDPQTGTLVTDFPPVGSSIRIEVFHTRIEAAYLERYQGLPPHTE